MLIDAVFLISVSILVIPSSANDEKTAPGQEAAGHCYLLYVPGLPRFLSEFRNYPESQAVEAKVHR